MKQTRISDVVRRVTVGNLSSDVLEATATSVTGRGLGLERRCCCQNTNIKQERFYQSGNFCSKCHSFVK